MKRGAFESVAEALTWGRKVPPATKWNWKDRAAEHARRSMWKGGKKSRFLKEFGSTGQGGITCGAIDEPRKSTKAIDERVIINFRDKMS